MINIQAEKRLVLPQEEIALLRALTDRVGITIENALLYQGLKRSLEDLAKSSDDLRRAYLQTAASLTAAIEAKDPYTAGHVQKVTQWSGKLAKKLGLGDEEITAIEVAATLHDVGKIGIPGELLSKPGKLSEQEFSLIKTHSESSVNIVAGVEFPWDVKSIIRQHHERWDGTGYPQGLRGEEIVLGARIIAVADAFEAMTSHRPYRPAKSLEETLTEIKSLAGKKFDPNVVEALLSLQSDSKREAIFQIF
jgi:putative nucleotidyltransferase with HDIG domain